MRNRPMPCPCGNGERHDYWYWIDQGYRELCAWGFMSERTLAGMRRHGIDPVQAELGWADGGDQ